MAGLPRAGQSTRGAIAAYAALVVALSLGVLAAVLAAPAPSRAQGLGQADDVFTVRVPVDTTADTAANARAQALADGQRRALRRVFERTVLAEDMARLPRLNDRQIEGLVQALEVDKERTSPVRYLAELTIRFKPGEVRGLLQQAGLRFAETRSRPVLVLPVLREGDSELLWEETNRWRRAWAETPARDGLVPIIVPIGDLTDGDTIDAAAALAGDEEKLAAIMQRYRAVEAIVAVAEPPVNPQPRAPLRLAVTRYGAPPGEDAQAGLAPEGGVFRAAGTQEEQMAAAVRDVAQRIENAWKRANVLRFGEEQQLTAILSLQNGLGDLVDARLRLGEVASVRRVEINAFTRQMARLVVTFSGEPQQLQAALAQKDMTLTAGAPDWQLAVIRPAVQPTAETPAPAPGQQPTPTGSQ